MNTVNHSPTGSGNKKMTFSIKAKLLLTLALCSFLILTAVGFILLQQVYHENDRMMNMNISGQTEAVRSEIDNYFGNIGGMLSATRNIPVFEDYIIDHSAVAKTGAAAGLKRGIVSFPQGTLNLYLVAKGDSSALNADGSDLPLDPEIFNERWWGIVSNNPQQAKVSRPHKDNGSGQMVLTVALPMLSNGEVKGAIAVDVPLGNLIQTVMQKKVGKEGYALLIDNFGYIVCDRHEEYIGVHVKDTGYSEEFAEKAMEKEPVWGFEYQVKGEKMHGAMIPMNNVTWRIVGTVTDDEYFEQTNDLAVKILISFAVAMIVLIGVIATCIVLIMKPVKKLQDITQKLADGELDVEVSIKTNDEMMILADNVSAIVDRLKSYIVYIDELSGALDQIGNRNLVFQLEQPYEGEFLKLKNSLLNIQSSLTEAMTTFSDAADAANVGSDNMAAGAQNLAQGTTEQASAVEQLAASIEAMNQRTEKDTLKASETSDNIKSVERSISGSNKEMQKLVSSMNNINNKSNEIAQIVSAVEDLAFQTNILSLNAAIEAAHAGQAGKGFAVVATEVGELAGRSAEAAKNISTLIGDANDAVQEGVEITKITAKSLDDATAQLLNVVKAIDDILNSYMVSAKSLKEFSAGVNQISSVVQNNSATSEESAATAEELATQVESIKQLVSTFKIQY